MSKSPLGILGISNYWGYVSISTKQWLGVGISDDVDIKCSLTMGSDVVLVYPECSFHCRCGTTLLLLSLFMLGTYETST